MNKHGRVEVTKLANFTEKEDGNPSLIGYKLTEEWLLRGKCFSQVDENLRGQKLKKK